jgi:hypothetical protein
MHQMGDDWPEAPLHGMAQALGSDISDASSSFEILQREGADQ